MLVFHVLISSALAESPQFDVYRSAPNLEAEGMYNGREFDILIYRVPFENVSEHDFTNGMMAAIDTISAETGLIFNGKVHPTLH